LDARAYNASSVGIDQQWELPLSLGGPVYIPKIYNGKNKTFFFFNYTAFRQKPGGNPSTVTLPTAQETHREFLGREHSHLRSNHGPGLSGEHDPDCQDQLRSAGD